MEALGIHSLETQADALLDALARDPSHQPAMKMLKDLVYAKGGASYVADRLHALAEANPSSVMLVRLAADILFKAERFAPSLRLYMLLIRAQAEISPNEYALYTSCLLHLGLFEPAMKGCNALIAQHPGKSAFYSIRSQVHKAYGDFASMRADMEKALALDPDNAELQYISSRQQLMVSGFREGYELYAKRDPLRKNPHPLAIGEWQGEELEGKKLLVIAEQGVGDVVMFLSLVPWLLGEGAKVVLAVSPAMTALVSRSFPEVEVVEFTAGIYAGKGVQADYYTPIGSLLSFIREYRPCDHPPFLKADSGQAAALRSKYKEAAGGLRLVGIAWHTTNAFTGVLRNIHLEKWLPLAAVPGVRLVSLQYGDHADEVAAFNRQAAMPLITDPSIAPVRNLDAAAAQLMAMDKVITIQNSTVHLAGALGVPADLLLSSASDWRWGTREDNRWYKSVTIHRQKKPLEWEGIIASIARQLAVT